MNVLFVCSVNQHRSVTAEHVFSQKYPHHNFRSAGTNHSLCEKLGTNKLREETLQWADVVLVMEQRHKNVISVHTEKKYENKIHVLDIEDVYHYKQKELVDLLIKKVDELLVL